jgi:hypothetical protein
VKRSQDFVVRRSKLAPREQNIAVRSGSFVDAERMQAGRDAFGVKTLIGKAAP